MALTADIALPIIEGEYGDFPVLNAVTIYEGAVVSITAAGYAKGYAGTDTIFAGIAQRQADNSSGAAGAINVRVRRDVHNRIVTLSSVAQSDVGTACYASDDGTFTMTVGSNLLIGTIVGVEATDRAVVRMEPWVATLADAEVTTAKLYAGAATLAKITFTGLKILTADGVNSTSADTEVTLAGTAVGDRVVAIFGVVKTDHAGAWLIPTIGTHFESAITVINKIVQLQAAGDISANTYIFILAPAAS